MEKQNCFQLKASFSPCAILQLTRYDLLSLENQLRESIQRAPNFFIGSPVILDIEKIQQEPSVDFLYLKKVLIDHGLVPVGVRGCVDKQQEMAIAAGLPHVSIGKSATDYSENKDTKTEPAKRQANESPEETITNKNSEIADTRPETTPTLNKTKLITSPIRSGMQVYAKDGDLIVSAQVSHGAELMADGHIHIYGALRGRALAGLQGNTAARIFCQKLDAELVAIAGYYLTKEDIQHLPKYDGMIQIYLHNEEIKIEKI